jgi:GH15 family glucan-1,4-alpha-glucosidase
MSAPIESYALIGDCETAALVGLDGSIDWLCWPRFDSGACFARLLGEEKHGFWRIAPDEKVLRVTRRYRDDSMVLETRFECENGTVLLVDCMPPRNGASSVTRLVIGCSGRVRMRMTLRLRFDYGHNVPWVRRLQDGTLQAVSGPDSVYLRTPTPHHGQGLSTVGSFDIGAGARIPFALTYTHSWLPPPKAPDVEKAIAASDKFWRVWCGHCSFGGRWNDAVRRSLLTLKALTYAPTGGIVAAPTTSLPEQIGGARNWDYRYCWLRDATLTLFALMRGGTYDEAKAWREWLLRAAAGSPNQMQIMYGIRGERRLPEWQMDWLPGYDGSSPVRVGNAAATQLQLDVYGEVIGALYQARVGGLGADAASWALERAVIEHIAKAWREPDDGIWEVRGGGRRHFTYSKAMCWYAIDRAVKTVEQFGVPGDVERWRALRDEIHEDVCTHGYDASRGHFTQSYGAGLLDGSLLLLPQIGFLPIDDPRIEGTIRAIEKHLVVDGFVLRYDTKCTEDGLPPGEGAFLACSFWLADAMAMQGRFDEAEALFGRLVGLANDVGLLAEEYDSHGRRQVGNFPQAFSHVALVNTAFNLHRRAETLHAQARGADARGHKHAARATA